MIIQVEWKKGGGRVVCGHCAQPLDCLKSCIESLIARHACFSASWGTDRWVLHRSLIAASSSFAWPAQAPFEDAHPLQAKVEIGVLQYLNKRADPYDEHNIVRMLDFFDCRGHLCLVFELLNMNLYELIKRNSFRGLAMNLLRSFLDQVGRACLQPMCSRLEPPLPAAGQAVSVQMSAGSSPAVDAAVSCAHPSACILCRPFSQSSACTLQLWTTPASLCSCVCPPGCLRNLPKCCLQ